MIRQTRLDAPWVSCQDLLLNGSNTKYNRLYKLTLEDQQRSSFWLLKIPLYDDAFSRTDNRQRRSRCCISVALTLLNESNSHGYLRYRKHDLTTDINTFNATALLIFRYTINNRYDINRLIYHWHRLIIFLRVRTMLTNQFTGAWTHYTDTVQGTRTDHMVESFQRISIE